MLSNWFRAKICLPSIMSKHIHKIIIHFSMFECMSNKFGFGRAKYQNGHKSKRIFGFRSKKILQMRCYRMILLFVRWTSMVTCFWSGPGIDHVSYISVVSTKLCRVSRSKTDLENFYFNYSNEIDVKILMLIMNIWWRKQNK